MDLDAWMDLPKEEDMEQEDDYVLLGGAANNKNKKDPMGLLDISAAYSIPTSTDAALKTFLQAPVLVADTQKEITSLTDLMSIPLRGVSGPAMLKVLEDWITSTSAKKKAGDLGTLKPFFQINPADAEKTEITAADKRQFALISLVHAVHAAGLLTETVGTPQVPGSTLPERYMWAVQQLKGSAELIAGVPRGDLETYWRLVQTQYLGVSDPKEHMTLDALATLLETPEKVMDGFVMKVPAATAEVVVEKAETKEAEDEEPIVENVSYENKPVESVGPNWTSNKVPALMNVSKSTPVEELMNNEDLPSAANKRTPTYKAAIGKLDGGRRTRRRRRTARTQTRNRRTK